MLRRRWLTAVFAVALAACFAQSPGRISADTKLDLVVDPLHFLRAALSQWNPDFTFGQVQNQAYGYLFPHGSFFALGELIGLPGWITQRLWWAVLLTVGFWGVLRVAETLGIGSTGSRLLAAAVYVTSPRVITTLGSISSETLPVMLAPWALLPVILALRGRGDPRLLAARGAVAIAAMGAVNAVATAVACLPAVIWWLAHRPGRTWLRFTAWWLPLSALACLWWLVPLVMLGRVSPPFLNFIESSRTTTQWNSLAEVLRGTDSWTPYVSPDLTAGANLLTQPAMIIATGALAAIGLYGLSRARYRGVLLAILAVGVIGLCVGYVGTLGSPIAGPVRDFLDGAGAPLRNVHKWDPLVRLPLALGIAALRLPRWQAWSHPERDRRVAVGLVTLISTVLASANVWTGQLAAPGTFTTIPGYWRDTAQYLANRDGRALILPGAPFAAQVWGLTRDEPLQALATSPWAVRDSIPLTPAPAIRALDSVEQLIAAGSPSTGLADTLAAQGITMVVLRNDLDPSTSRSTRPILAHQAIEGSPGLTKVAQFGDQIGAGTVVSDDGNTTIVADEDLRPHYPAIEVYAVQSTAAPAGPYLAQHLPVVSGGPESLLRIAERRQALGESPLGPTLLASDTATNAGSIVTDTPVDREVDFGRVDNHSSALLNDGDPRRTLGAVRDYPAGVATDPPRVIGSIDGARISVSSSAADATQLGEVRLANDPAAAIDGDAATSWISNGLESALGQWIQLDFDGPVTNAVLSLTTSAATLGSPVKAVSVTTSGGSRFVATPTPGEPVTVALPPQPTTWVRITAATTENGSAGAQFGVSELGVSQFDADGTAHPIILTRHVDLPAPTGPVTGWDLGATLPDRAACATGPDRVHCSAALPLAPEEPGVMRRTLSVPTARAVANTTVWLRAVPGTALAAAALPGRITADGASNVPDLRGSAFAAVDGDPRTSWTAPDDHTTAQPTITLRLPRPQLVSDLTLTPSAGALPAKATDVIVNLGDGPQARHITDDHVALHPHVTDTITVTITAWNHVVNHTALGFDQDGAPGFAEISPDGVNPPIDPTTPVTMSCTDPRAPAVAVSGQVTPIAVTTTVGALLSGAPIAAAPCAPITLAAGRQELTINPGTLFTVDGVDLDADLTPAQITPIAVSSWGDTARAVTVPATDSAQVLVVPESVNPGWHATDSTGRELTPIVVNGWQQGWTVPAGTSGAITLTYASNALYRTAIGVGFVLLAGVFALAWRAPTRTLPAARRYRNFLPLSGLALVLTGGIAGLIALVLALIAALTVRRRILLVVAAPLAFAGLAHGPWRAASGYLGGSALVQGAALIALASAFAAATPRLRTRRKNATRAGSSTKE